MKNSHIYEILLIITKIEIITFIKKSNEFYLHL